MKKATFILLFVLLAVSCVCAQSLTGRVVDENGNPLYPATVIQLTAKDSTMLDVALTDSLGVYFIPVKSDVNSVIKISFFGYEDYFFSYNPDQHYVRQDIGDIALTSKSFLLNEVVVKGNSPTLSRKADHFSFSLANTELVKGNSTWEVLKFTPFLKVDDLAGVEMIGRGQVTVYINGRKTRFAGSSLKSYLESLPAEEIVTIEIETTKNSTSRAEDSSGSINIILKKNELEGFKGTFSLSDKQSDYTNFWDASTFMNYKKNKVDLTANVFVNKYDNRQTNSTNYNYLNEKTATTANDVIRRDDIDYGLQFNMDYRPVANHILGIMVNTSIKDNRQKGLNFNYYQPIGRLCFIF